MRALALLLAAVTGIGCYSTHTVPAAGLASLKTPHDEEGVVHADDGDAIRIDPNSEIRFRRTDGTWTRWHVARHLWVNGEGVFVVEEVPLDRLESIRASALLPGDALALRAAVPKGALAGNDDELVVEGTSADLSQWMKQLLAARAAPLSGRWSFHDGIRTYGAYGGEQVPRVVDQGFAAVDGLKWSDVAEAEVHNLSGGKTLVGVAATTLIVAALVPIALVARKGPDVPLRALGTVAHVGARTAVHVAVHSKGCCGSSSSSSTASSTPAPSSDEVSSESLTAPGYSLPNADGGRLLFDGETRRRSIARIGASIDVGSALVGKQAWSMGAVPTLRFVDLLEVGLGARWLARGPVTHVVPVFRLGLHAELDPHRRFATPLSFDFGGGGNVAFHFRLNFGFRLRVYDGWWVGLHPFNPSYVGTKTPLGREHFWSFPTMIETSFMF